MKTREQWELDCTGGLIVPGEYEVCSTENRQCKFRIVVVRVHGVLFYHTVFMPAVLGLLSERRRELQFRRIK